MAQYMTEQKTILLEFLREHGERSYTIEELMQKMRECAEQHAPGKSTVYRIINRLCDEGKVKRFAREGGRSFVYQAFLGEHCSAHLHMKCIKCGRLLHLEHALSDELLDKIKKESDFAVSESDTVLFGNCADCRLGGNGEKN